MNARHLSATLLILVLSLSYGTQSSANADEIIPTYWKKLLHFGNNESRVISHEFFLSPKGNTDPVAELKTTIQLLNSIHGQEIACNFPARYIWLKGKNYPVPEIDLDKCFELTKFVKSFQNETISIVYASEFLNEPSSSFGHIFLLFHNKSEPILLSDLIHFSAVTEKDSFLTYSYRGLTGGYKGYFFREPFFVKKHAYNILEQRHLYKYTLGFTQEQINKIINHLYELRKATFRYYFIDENCAFHIAMLLGMAFEKDHDLDMLLVPPIDILKSYKNKITDVISFMPTISRAESILNSMTEHEKKVFFSVIEQQQVADNKLPNKVKDALINYYQYSFRRENRVFQNYDDVIALQYEKLLIENTNPDPISRRPNKRFTIGAYERDNTESILLAYRPLQIDRYDLQKNQQQESELTFLNTNILVRNDKAQFENIDILSIRSLSKRNELFNPTSWTFYTGLNRKNIDHKLSFEIEAGIGLTYQLSIGTFSAIVAPGIDFKREKPYLKPAISLAKYISKDIKFGVSGYTKYYDGLEYYYQQAFFTFGFDNFTITAMAEQDNSQFDKGVSLVASLYF